MATDHLVVADWIASFVFLYPLLMAYIWVIGAVAYYLHYERHSVTVDSGLPLLRSLPRVSVLVPCFNESAHVLEVFEALGKLDYPNYEVVAINDGSTDNTAVLLDGLLERYSWLRVLHQDRNQGKAVALNTGALLAQGEYLMCIDGDSLLAPDAIPWLLRHFQNSPRVGAVTGNPRIRNRSSLLGRIQVGEFSSIVGLIKRSQRTYGRLFTASGVVAMFRRRALLHAGFWSKDILTEDIDISWKLQTHHWDVRFEPRALCWILMPETLRGLWKQRLRWAMGGIQSVLKYLWIVRAWKQRRMWPILIEYFVSVIWAYAAVAMILIGLIGLVVPLPHLLQISLIPGWCGMLLCTTSLLQLFTASILDRHYDDRLWQSYFWAIWYPLVFWLVTATTTVVALPRVLLRQRGLRAIWVSPDRGYGS